MIDEPARRRIVCQIGGGTAIAVSAAILGIARIYPDVDTTPTPNGGLDIWATIPGADSAQDALTDQPEGERAGEPASDAQNRVQPVRKSELLKEQYRAKQGKP